MHISLNVCDCCCDRDGQWGKHTLMLCVFDVRVVCVARVVCVVCVVIIYVEITGNQTLICNWFPLFVV